MRYVNDTDDRGFTLLETVVAMALFLSVLVPMIGALNNLMLDNRTEVLWMALAEARSTIDLAVSHPEVLTPDRQVHNGFMVQVRKIWFQRRMDIQVTVSDLEAPDNILVALQRSIPSYR